MRVPSLIASSVLVTLVLAGCSMGGTKTTTSTVTVTRTVTTQASPGQGALGQTANARYFGTPISITQVDAKRYLLILKPQFFLVGVAANVAFAASQGTQCPPLTCPAVEDDRWVIPAGTQNLTFVLPATTKGTVLTLSQQQMHTTTVTGMELAAIVGGAQTPHLMEPLDSGLWLTIDGDKVTSFAQQFQP